MCSNAAAEADQLFESSGPASWRRRCCPSPSIPFVARLDLSFEPLYMPPDSSQPLRKAKKPASCDRCKVGVQRARAPVLSFAPLIHPGLRTGQASALSSRTSRTILPSLCGEPSVVSEVGSRRAHRLREQGPNTELTPVRCRCTTTPVKRRPRGSVPAEEKVARSRRSASQAVDASLSRSTTPNAPPWHALAPCPSMQLADLPPELAQNLYTACKSSPFVFRSSPS